ncbi:hypothetical protein [Pelobacter seleniigenes]|uniref:hypothetical protein n=1 Tax=Pelobacter seleniigenes TaxID=407188 RepID=UPI0004A7429F|nr:hypothetical protein [Pelobacter seleniigenes]
MSILKDLIKQTEIPEFIPAYQSFADDCITDIPSAVVTALNESGLSLKLPVHKEVAIGVGSRGIANLPALVASTVTWFRCNGCKPFVIPCMGSHGGATGPGQVKVLADLGITEETVGCPIRSSMEVVEVGQLDNGLPVYMDKNAWNADGVFIINRVKTHTSFSGTHESGLVKMLTIGLGKQKGANAAHCLGYFQFPTIMPAMARMVLERKPAILGGLAVVENALENTCLVEAVTSEKILDRDASLLAYSKTLMPSLPIQDLDLLIIDRIGKNISGAGMDPNITGRHGSPAKTGGPNVNRLVTLGLTEETKGNATGMGNADIIPRSMADGINFEYTYANVITSTSLSFVRMPMVLETDEDVLRCGVKTSSVPAHSIRAIRILDTLHLDKLLISPAVATELEGNERIRIVGEQAPLHFNSEGKLDRDIWRQVFPNSEL